MTLGSTALVTGASAGLGHEFARQLAGRGHDLVLVARSTERLEEVADQLRTTYGVSVEVLTADLSERAGMALVEERLADPARPVDLLVNNAGYGLKRRFLDNTIDAETANLDVLVTAVLRLSHAALGPMVERGPDPSGRRGVINVSSVAGFLPGGTYSAAKAYVNSFGRWAHNEYAGRGITVTTLCPGFTKTEFHERMEVRRGSGPLWLDAERVVADALADFDRGRSFSIPSNRYKAIVAVARAVPAGVIQRLGSFRRH